jgi:hypothetical protein
MEKSPNRERDGEIYRSTYKNPVRRLSREVFPAPEGPIIAVSSPDLNVPDTPFKTCFGTATIQCEGEKSDLWKQ